MSERLRARRGLVAAAVLALAAVTALAVVGAAGAKRTASCGTVTVNEQAWSGSTANTYVAKNVLESIGCKVNITQIAEIPVYQAMADGKVDAVLEDWQHVAQYKQYINQQHTAVMGGPNGVIGHIGWYIPTYLMKQYPQFKTWKGLKGKESIFKSPESGSQGMFLGGDPSYVQKDQQLIQALGLNFKFVSVGAEPAQVARWTQLYKQHKPVLFYWYTPQYLNTEYQLSEVMLPPRFKGCQDDASSGGERRSVQVRVRERGPEQGLQREVREERLARLRGAEAVQLVERRPGERRQADRREPHGPGQGGEAVDRGQQGQGQQVAR